MGSIHEGPPWMEMADGGHLRESLRPHTKGILLPLYQADPFLSMQNLPSRDSFRFPLCVEFRCRNNTISTIVPNM